MRTLARVHGLRVAISCAALTFGCDAIVGVHDLPLSGDDGGASGDVLEAGSPMDSGQDAPGERANVESDAIADGTVEAEPVDVFPDESVEAADDQVESLDDAGTGEAGLTLTDADASEAGSGDTGAGDGGGADIDAGDSASEASVDDDGGDR